MLSYLSSFIWETEETEITPDEKQVRLRHILHRQITLNKMVLKSIDAKPSISDGLIEYELNRLTEHAEIPIKRKKIKKRKYFSNLNK